MSGHALPLDKEAIQAVIFMQKEARQHGMDFVTPEHLLLAVLHQPLCRACLVLAELGVDIEGLRQQTEVRLPTGPGCQEPRLHLTELTRRVADLWPEEAARSGSDHIGTEHQFLALIRRAEGITAGLLAGQGIEEKAFRAQAAALP